MNGPRTLHRYPAELQALSDQLERETDLRRQAEAQLHLQKVALEAAANAIVITDRQGTIEWINPAFTELTGYSRAEAIGSNPRMLKSGQQEADFYRRFWETIRAGEVWHGDLINRRKDGSLYVEEQTVAPVRDANGTISRFIAIKQDVTAQRQAQEALREAAAAAERERLAHDLHDAVTQTLFSASLIADVLPRLWEIDPSVARENLDKIGRLIRGALVEMRTLLFELRPAALTERPLAELLRSLGETLKSRTQIPVMVTVEGSREPPAEVRIALYRIAQEALNNVARHAGATQVNVSLHCGDGGTELSIIDDGCGFDPGAIPPGHLGVGIMRKRAETVGAHLTIETDPGQGTRLSVVWPCEKRDAAESGPDE